MVPESRGRGRPAQRWILDTKDTLGIKVHEIGQLARQQESYFTHCGESNILQMICNLAAFYLKIKTLLNLDEDCKW